MVSEQRSCRWLDVTAREGEAALQRPSQLSSLVLPGSTCHFLDVVCPQGNLNSCEVSADEQCSFQ